MNRVKPEIMKISIATGMHKMAGYTQEENVKMYNIRDITCLILSYFAIARMILTALGTYFIYKNLTISKQQQEAAQIIGHQLFH